MRPGGDHSHIRWRRSALAGIGVGLILIPVGHPGREFRPVAQDGRLKPVVVSGSGTLTMPNSTSKAITYDPDLAPIGAAMTATVVPTSDGSRAQLTVLGLLPDRGYAVYAYDRQCGADADAVGARFQNRPDPAATSSEPSTDPQYANPDNEIWLDVRTDDAGAGTSATTIPFVLTDRVPGSLVVHDAMHTPRNPSQLGNIGVPIACLTLFRR